MDTFTIQRSNSKVFQNVDEAREFWEKGKKKKSQTKKTHNCCLPGDVFEWGGKKTKERNCSKGWIFHFGQKRFGVASGRREKMRRRGWRVKPKSMCVLFNVTADTVQKDGIVYAWFEIGEASGGRGGNGAAARSGAERGRGNQALVQTLDRWCNFTR